MTGDEFGGLNFARFVNEDGDFYFAFDGGRDFQSLQSPLSALLATERVI